MLNIKNIRFGFATNSSSTHSLVFIENNNIKTDEYTEFGWQYFHASDEESKTNYLAYILKSAIYEKTKSDLISNMFIKGYFGKDIPDGYVDHQSKSIVPYNMKNELNLEFFEDFKKFILNKNLVIFGGNDNDENGSKDYPANSKCININIPEDTYSSEWISRKETDDNSWTLFNKKNGRKINFKFDVNFNSHKIEDQKIVFTRPQLVDLKITDYCDIGCTYCYQNSTKTGKHASLDDIRRIIWLLQELEVFEIAIGGGEPTSHPNFIEILESCRDSNIIPNFTTKNFKWLEDKEYLQKVLNLTGGIAFSVNDYFIIKKLGILLENCKDYTRNNKINLQVVLGTVNEFTFKRILEEAHYWNFNVTLLGPKQTGRGKNFKYQDYSFWIKVIKQLKDEYKCPSIGIDTCIAKEFEIQLKENQINECMYYTKEGTVSCYIDAVTNLLYPSSYHLDKSYDIKLSDYPKNHIEKAYKKMQKDFLTT